MNLANRGARIASLKAMNNRLRQIAPEQAWADSNIENASNAELDQLQDQISAALVEAQRGPAPVNPLRAELEALSGTELRDLMGRMGLAGKLMTAGERVDALLAEDPAEVRAAMQQAEPSAPAPAEPTAAEQRRQAVSEADQKLAQTVAFYGLRGQDDFGKALLRALETSTTPRSLGRFATKGTVSEVQRRKAQTLADNGRLPVVPAVILDKQGVPLSGVYLQLPFADPRADDFWNRRVLEDIGAVGNVVYPAGAWTSQPASTATEPASGKKSSTGSSPTASPATSTSVASTATDSGSQSQQNKLVVNYGGGKTRLDLERPAWQYSQAEMAKAIEDQWGGSGVADFFKEAHLEAVEVAARNGEPLPAKVLYDFPRFIRRDLSDSQADEATDAMVDVYRATKDYERAVQAYRDFGKTLKQRADSMRRKPEGEAAAQAAPGVVENFGEALPPARRNMAAKLTEDLTNDDIANRPFSEVWPLAENEAIEDPFAAAVAHAARAEVPAKPRVPYKLREWVKKVQMLRDLAGKIVGGSITRERMGQRIEREFPALRDWWTKVQLLESLPRDQWKRIGTVEERPKAISYAPGGQQVPNPMLRLEVDGKGKWLTGDPGVEDEARGTVAGNRKAITALLTAAEPEQRMEFSIYERRKDGSIFVAKKGDPEKRELMTFADAKEARKAINEQYDSLVAAWEAVKARDNITERDLRSAENRPRVGKDYRKGRDITVDEFQAVFGFRGGEFGKWVQQGKGDKDRQALLNNTHDALMDLAAILNVPPRAMSLNGTLGIALGSRGSGWASAHFEPSNLVINLTKTRGAGTLAHEWFHALDNHFSRLRGGEVPFKGNQNEYRDNNYITHKPEPLMVHKAGRWPPMPRDKLEARRAANPTAPVYAADNWMPDPKHPAGVRPEVEQRFADLVKALNDSPMAKRAALLDKGGGYWSRTLELAARAFESHVIAKMHEQGYHNDFLVNVKKLEETGKADARYPYLLAGEVKPIADAFDALFSTIQTRPADAAGNIALFSRNPRYVGFVSPASLRTEVSKITANWDQDLADVSVVNRVEDLPADIRQAVRNVGSENTVRGLAMPDGRVFLVAENISTIEEGRFVLFHEVYGHVGMQAFLGDGYATQMRVLRTANPALAREADAWFDRYGEDEIAARVKAGFSEAKARAMVEALAVEEALADRAGTLPELKGWKLVMAALQRGLRRLGLGSVADMLEGMTEAETVDLLVQARRTVQAGQRVRGVEMAGNPAFQRVWHGTHTRGIEEFSTDYIGTGEGVQAFGWGLYFATKKEIAEHYREKLSAGGKFTRIDGKRWDFGSDLSRPLTESERLDNLAVGMLQQAQSASGLEALAKRRDADPAVVKRAREMLPRVSWAPSGQTYEVDIPEDSEMLLWDKPLSEQPQAIRDAVYGASEGKWVTGQSGERRFIEAPAAWMTGGAAYARVSRLLGGDIQASKALRAAGIRGIKYLDGTSRNAGDGTYNYVIFDGADAQITGALFSRRPDRAALRDAIPHAVQEWVSDRMVSQRGFNRIWHRTVGTQIHKAKVNKEFGRAYYAVQDFMKDVSRMATLAAEKAPDMLPQIETLNDLARLAPTLASPAAYKQRKADIKAASDALFDGTLRYTRDDEGKAVKVDPDSDELGGLVWTDAELKARGMSARAIAMYRQSRAAIEQSLDSMLAADLYRQVSVMDPELVAATPSDYTALMAGLRRAAASDTPGDAVQSLRSAIASRLDAVQGALDGQPNQHTPGLMQRRQDLRKLQEMIGEKVNRIQDLKDAGYAPLMRFGPYAVDVVNPDGRRVFFGMYESQAAANQAARNFRGDGLIVTQSVMPQKQFEALQGVSPETAMLFAEMLGVEKNEAMQTWLKNAVAEQSALKRHIRRKGIEGFDDDGGRVLAAFITSNARAASRALHSQRISEAVENIRQGDVQDEARALAEYVSNPKEEAQAIRSLLFVQYIGGSIASAIVNLTQTVVQTFPFLSQYGGGIKAGQRIGAAVKQALAGKIDAPDLAAAVARAEKDGIIKPQEVFQLQAEASRNLGSNLYARSLLAAWGSMFQLAEVFNRRVAFIAAYQTAKEQGIADPFGFAENAVDETQSVFNKGNRPNWARGAVGATIFTFKTFTIQYVEFLKRLATAGEPGSPERARGQKAAALALLSLVVLAGMKGLPFAEDAEDLIDTVAQALGYNWTTDAAMDKWLDATLGEVWSDIVQHGMSGVPGVPFDVSQRLGMANLLPGTGLLKQSETNKQNQVLEVFGVAGSAVRDATQGQFLPIAIRNLMIGLDTYETGLYRDRRGRAVTEADPLDAALKAIGLQPNNVARAQRDIGRQIELRSLYQAVKEEITDSWAQAQFAGDMEGVAKARAALQRWNDTNPEARIIILPRTVQQRVMQMRRSKAERTIANAPTPLRASTAEALQ